MCQRSAQTTSKNAMHFASCACIFFTWYSITFDCRAREIDADSGSHSLWVCSRLGTRKMPTRTHKANLINMRRRLLGTYTWNTFEHFGVLLAYNATTTRGNVKLTILRWRETLFSQSATRAMRNGSRVWKMVYSTQILSVYEICVLVRTRAFVVDCVRSMWETIVDVREWCAEDPRYKRRLLKMVHTV